MDFMHPASILGADFPAPDPHSRWLERHTWTKPKEGMPLLSPHI